ncbi:MAG: M23 family metallopeptidase [Mariprofundus sp.]
MRKSLVISTSGSLFGIVIGRNVFISCSVAVLAALAFGVWGLFGAYQHGHLSYALQQSKQAFDHAASRNHAKVEKLQIQLQAEQQKLAVYARALGQIQARMARLDALGSRLVDVASLDKSEFDFDLEPAFGGPRQQQPDLFAIEAGLRDGLQYLDGRLKQTGAQLSAVDYLLENKRTELQARPHAWPTEGGWISSRFGPRIDPFSGAPAKHQGIDIANRFGAPVVASSRGIVTFAGKMIDFGYVVDIEHGYGYKTRYAHMESLSVKVGDVVAGNKLLGRVGSTGHSTGPHLHYEVRRYGKLINPRSFLPRG